MDEATIRQIVQSEIQNSQSRGRFGFQNTQFHAHTSIDGTPPIRQENVIPSLSASGSIVMNSESTYTLQFGASFTPRSVFVTGNAQSGSGSGDARYMFIGTAQLSPSFYFQPVNSRTVVTGGPQYPFTDPNNSQYGNNIPMQSCTYWGSESQTGTRHTVAGNFHIIDIQYPGGTGSLSESHARVTIIDFSKTSITLVVDTLDPTWTINANFVVT